MEVRAVNLSQRLVILDDDRICAITTLVNGEDLEASPEDAKAAVAFVEPGVWITIDLSKFTNVSLH